MQATDIKKKASDRSIPLDRMNPPRRIRRSTTKDPKVFATIIFLLTAAMNRKRPDAI